jgi:hypothetical protein
MDGLAGCEGVAGLSQAARNVVEPGEMRRDELGTAAGVGMLGERVEGAYGDCAVSGCGGDGGAGGVG